MTNLADLVEGLKRQVAVPGEFDTTFPNTLDTDLVGSLADGFAMAQLDGFFGDQAFDPATNSISPDLSAAGAVLVTLYAQERILLAKLRNMVTKTTYKAGNVEYSTELSANVLSAEIKTLQQQRTDIKAQALRIARASNAVYMVDAYITRSYGYFPFLGLGDWGGFFDYELVTLAGW